MSSSCAELIANFDRMIAQNDPYLEPLRVACDGMREFHQLLVMAGACLFHQLCASVTSA